MVSTNVCKISTDAKNPGRTYLEKIAGPLVKDIISCYGSFEVWIEYIFQLVLITFFLNKQTEKRRADKGVNVRENSKKILSITKEFLDHIIASTDQCPMYISILYFYLLWELLFGSLWSFTFVTQKNFFFFSPTSSLQTIFNTVLFLDHFEEFTLTLVKSLQNVFLKLPEFKITWSPHFFFPAIWFPLL